ncbi:hypothetical protein BO83DRAFT_206866 [Aspergillus eucalypticola CBS 122712]|uniref:Uncharacterized protein n=1 Tax=Aspergillus eucalypticola (strain CBS 122712 / IBT 29274) TaxID=1448314 RepID=A0A317UIS7_ASPEC|nr:uncharacterized protein BO83DRAFT_206866 [Aspergillus eucalypticola CBS 122712]PWY61994.1 hypothetical protein BO83DRAFT_206866 [Aspergillus eucalypticola CBS 122712]
MRDIFGFVNVSAERHGVWCRRSVQVYYSSQLSTRSGLPLFAWWSRTSQPSAGSITEYKVKHIEDGWGARLSLEP